MSDIGFSQIPANNKKPLFHLEFAPTGQPGNQPQNSLIVAPTITAAPAKPVYCPSVGQAVALFGANSIAAAMAQKLFAADPQALLYVLPLADAGGGTAASGAILFSGTVSGAQTLSLYICGRLVPVALANGTTAAQTATAVAAAINAYVDRDGIELPVTAAVDGDNTALVDITADNKGTPGNSIDIRLNYYGIKNGEVTPNGITVTITAMSSGATDPTLPSLDALMANTNYDFIAIPWSTAGILNSFQTLMAARWNDAEKQYGGVWSAKMDADATGTTNLAFGTTRNDPHTVCVSYEPAPNPPWDVAAAYMGGASASLRADPARPVWTLSVPGILAPAEGERYTDATQQGLLSSGMALMDYNADGTCSILRAVTTYQKNQFGATDLSYLDVTTTYLGPAYVRSQKAAVTTAFPRAKYIPAGASVGAGNNFTNGLPDQPIVTNSSIKSCLVANYQVCANKGWVQDAAAYAKTLIVQQNANDPSRADVLDPPVFVTGLATLAVLNQFTNQAPAAS